MNTPLNLARRPFGNETLPALVLGLAIAGLLVGTAFHVRAIAGVLSLKTSALEDEAQGLETEAVRIRKAITTDAPRRPSEDVMARWTVLKDLVDRRTFSWSALLSRLEQLQPAGVRLLSIAPSSRKGTVNVEISAVARSEDDGLAFVHALEESPEFAEVYPLSVGERQGEFDYRYRMRYVPPALGPSVGQTPASSTKDAVPAEDEGAVEDGAAAPDGPPTQTGPRVRRAPP